MWPNNRRPWLVEPHLRILLGQDKPRFGGAVFYGLRTIMAGGLVLREWTRSRRGHLMQSIKLESSFHHA